MRHVRPNIEEFWDFAYRRAIGISLITFALLLAVGIMFSTTLGGLIGQNYFIYAAFWTVLVIIMVFVFAASFAGAHILSSRNMSKKEYSHHSIYMALWVLSAACWVAVFISPFFLIQNVPTSIIMLSFAGVMLAAYLTTAMLFEIYHHEVAYGAIILLIAFFITFFNIGGILPSGVNPVTVLMLSTITIVVVSGFTGLMLLISAALHAERGLRG